jgi:predicted phosphate transport protein (TIGR00153 family)
VAFRLIPKEEKFYDDFTAVAVQITKGAALLEQMIASDPPRYDIAHEIKEIEHRCDSLTHSTIQRLNQTFVTPLDREDIFEMARSLDDCMDAIDHCATLISLYEFTSIRPGARELAKLLTASAEAVKTAVSLLDKKIAIAPHIVEINRLENEADRVHLQAVKDLFREEQNPISVIKWKELLDELEKATDECEDVANVLEGIVVKHS